MQHGKNFEAIKAHVEKKHLSSKADPGLVKTKEQVRHLYYRTWAKISKYIHHKEGKIQVPPPRSHRSVILVLNSFRLIVTRLKVSFTPGDCKNDIANNRFSVSVMRLSH